MDILIKVQRDIEKVRQDLIKKVETNGIYENFGVKEVRKLQDKYNYYDYNNNKLMILIDNFENWCCRYNG